MNPARILVVEDEAIVAADLEECLTRLGYEVTAVASAGDQAIEKAGQLKPDLVLMDIILDGHMDGIQAAEIIQERFEIPIIYLTAHADQSTLNRAGKTGPFGYILKPFQDRELHSSIEVAICRSQMEEQYKKLAPWLKAVLNGIGDGVIATNTDGIVMFINPAAEALCGWKSNEILGMGAAEVLDLEDWETEERITLSTPSILNSTGSEQWKKDLALISPDGVKHPVEFCCSPIFDEKKIVTGALLIFRDTADVKRASEEKLRIQANVQRMQKLETLGRMAGGISHDLNNVLTTVLGYTQLAHRNITKKSALKFNLTQIQDVTRRAVDLNKKIRGYSLKNHDAIRRVDLNEIVQDTEDLLPWAWGAGVSVEYQLASEMPTILANPLEIRQVVINLAINAIEAIGKDQGRIKISTEVVNANSVTLKKFDLLSPLPAGDYITLVIEDNGCGIKADLSSEIFKPFYTTKSGNNGLGLTAALDILRRYQGTIGMKSEPGPHTVFKVLFPVIKESPVKKPTYSAAPIEWQGSGCVLVVDDEETVCRVSAEFLESMGFVCMIANNGLDALNLFSENSDKITCVLLDFCMPGLGGAATFKRVRQIKNDARVLLMSGVLEKEEVHHFFERGLSGFLEKPFVFEEFRDRIWGMLHAHSE